jgi:hypothetical protein
MAKVLASFEEAHPVLAARDGGRFSKVDVPAQCERSGAGEVEPSRTVTVHPTHLRDDASSRRLMADSDRQGSERLEKHQRAVVALDVAKWYLAVDKCTGERTTR